MAHTARNEEEKKEYFDPPDVLEQKVAQLAQWIKQSKHMITFTGAGISTGAGIPDYRSGMNTALQTGPGVWELRANKSSRDDKHKLTPMLKAIPTPTHMMLVKLQQEGIMKCCVSQNTDGLHRRSGLPKSALCELHGNSNLEVCEKCGNEYLRDGTLKRRWAPGHYTGKKCDDSKCGGPLKDNIVHFGENLPESELQKAFDEGEVADLCLVLGSSITVSPASHIPENVAKRRQRLVIVNLQRTPLHNAACLVIHAKCEDVSTMLMEHLGLEIPQFKLRRRLIMKSSRDPADAGHTILSIIGKDMDGLPFSFFKEVEVHAGKETHMLTSPYQLSVPWKESPLLEQTVKVTITFFGNYGEPPLSRDVNIRKDQDVEESVWIIYNPVTRHWEVTPITDI